MMAEVLHVSFKVNKDTHPEIFEFLKDKPKTYVCMQALDLYRQDAKLDAKSVRESKANPNDADALFGGFGG